LPAALRPSSPIFVKQEENERDTLDLEKTEEVDTADLTVDRSEEVTADLDAAPVRRRFDSSRWITSW
jgi:hypothetical protein